MIIKTFIAFIICFISFNAYVLFVKPTRLKPQHQYHDNLCKAENFILNNKNTEVAILGSSLGNRLNQDLLPHQWVKLTFSGQSSLEGLEIVSRSGKNVKYVFLEINVLSRTLNESFIKDIYPPILTDLKRPFPALRVKYEPVSLIYPTFAYIFYGAQKKFINILSSKSDPANVIAVTDTKPQQNLNSIEPAISHPTKTIVNPIIQIQYNDYSKKLDSSLVISQLIQIKHYIELLEAKKIKVIFYEMPVDSQLRHLPLSEQIRNCFYDKFPNSKYSYIMVPDSVTYNTSDAIHLTGKSIDNYTIFFREQVSKFISSR